MMMKGIKPLLGTTSFGFRFGQQTLKKQDERGDNNFGQYVHGVKDIS